MHIKYNFIYLLFFIIPIDMTGMHIAISPVSVKKLFLRNCFNAENKSKKLDKIRQKLIGSHFVQEIVTLSKGKIAVKEKIDWGKRYGTCHNYAFTKLMGIVGKAPEILNIVGQDDYYVGTGVDILDFFDPIPSSKIQQGDLVVYFSDEPMVTHTGIIVGNDRIESKWGTYNAIFEHPLWYVSRNYGDDVCYFRPQIKGHELLVAVQNRLQKKEVKEKYDSVAVIQQQKFFDMVERALKVCCCSNMSKVCISDNCYHHTLKIHDELQFYMNIHVDTPDKNGMTPYMLVEKKGCKNLQTLFDRYSAVNE